MNVLDLQSSPTTGAHAAVQAHTACTHDHHVQFYETDDFLFDNVSAFLGDGLAAGQPIVLAVTAAHYAGFSERLAGMGHDFERLVERGQVTHLDAHDTLSKFMVDGMPDAQRFRSTLGAVIEESLRGSSHRSVRAYGEMVDVLWREGNSSAAIRLEELWNDLAEAYSFELLCAYSMGNFYSEAHTQQLAEVCRQHNQVMPAETYTLAGDEAARGREIVLLQQRSLALENEISHRTRLEGDLRDALADRRTTESALRASVKSEFLAVMSHELRTPLNAIVGYRELLSQEVGGPIGAEQQVFLDRMKTASDQLTRLIDQILSFSRLEAGKESLELAPADLNDLVRTAAQLVAPVAAHKNLVLEVLQCDEPVVCETDGGKVSQIVLNLLSNAVKFTPDGGVQVRVWRKNGHACVDVADTGPGIAEADQRRIFDPFVQVDSTSTRAHGGTGLGLAVSRDLALLLGGRLDVESAAGEGCRFTLRVPIRQALPVGLQ